MANTGSDGSTAAQVAGVLVGLYGFIIFVSSFIASDSLNIASAILLTLSALAIIVGVGICKHNYYAWIIALVLNIISLISGGVQLVLLFLKNHSAEASNIASKLFWPLILFWLLYSARGACKANKSNSLIGIVTVKSNFAILLPIMITLITMLCFKANGAGAFVFIGLPVLAMEFGLFYIVGQNLQKRLKW